MTKFFFGLFTFAFGLALGLFFPELLEKVFPGISSPYLKGALFVVIVVFFFFVWRLTEKLSSKNNTKKKDQSDSNPA